MVPAVATIVALCYIPLINQTGLPSTMSPEHVAAQRAYMRYHNMNPIFGTSSKWVKWFLCRCCRILRMSGGSPQNKALWIIWSDPFFLCSFLKTSPQASAFCWPRSLNIFSMSLRSLRSAKSNLKMKHILAQMKENKASLWIWIKVLRVGWADRRISTFQASVSYLDKSSYVTTKRPTDFLTYEYR